MVSETKFANLADMHVKMSLTAIDCMFELKKSGKGTAGLVSDCRKIEIWMKETYPFSYAGFNKLENALRSHCVSGRFPSAQLKDSYVPLLKIGFEEGWDKLLPPPVEVFEVFERMAASDEETAAVKHLWPGASKGVPVGDFKRNLVKKWKPILIFISIFWILYVIIRSNTDFEFIGYRFDSWNGNYWFINMTIPLVIIWTGAIGWRWLETSNNHERN